VSITLVWRTDVHLSDNPPSSRKDDWTSTVLDKLRQVGVVAAKVQAAAVLDGGDFFHVKSPSRNTHDLIRRTAEVHAAYPCPVYANVGNHDCVYGDYGYLDQQPLGVLFSTGVFRRLYDEHEAVFVQDGFKVRVVGVPYHGTQYDLDRFRRIRKGDEDVLVCVAHVLASARGGSMFEGEDILSYDALPAFEPDLFCFLPGTAVTDWSGRVLPIEGVTESLALQGRGGPVAVEKVHPVRVVDEDVFTFDVEGVPSALIPGVTGEHPFWVAKGLQCTLPSRATRRCHPDKVRTSHPCATCNDFPQVVAAWHGASSVEGGDYMAIPFPKVPPDAVAAHGLARLLGYYLAEGHLIRNRAGEPVAGVGWSFHAEEHTLHQDVHDLVQEHFGLETKQHSLEKYGNRSMQVCAYGKDITQFFHKHGGCGAAKKVMSSWVWGLSASSRIELLVGWLLGDGHARSVKSEVIGCTVSPSLASQMFLLALSVGFRPYYTIRPARTGVAMPGGYTSDTLPAHILTFYGDDAEALSHRMGVQPPPRSKTKVEGFFHDGLFWRRVRGVQRRHYNGPVYNMRTSTQEYTAGLLLTHNCFGHWHKDQGVEVVNGKTIVNIGSLTRGSLSQDEVDRKPACAVMTFAPNQTPQVRVVRLRVAPANEVFDVAGRDRAVARASTVDTFAESVRARLTSERGRDVADIVAGLDVPNAIRERVLLYLERAGG
jgi:hypothetical protein